MATNDVLQYYEATRNRDTREDMQFAVEQLDQERTAIDCGCGAGSDIAFLRKSGFTVHAFDIEPASIERCQRRFAADSKVHLSVDSFSTFKYPSASLVVADASLFFCPMGEFESVWASIVHALPAGGIFCGSFLGPEDTMAGAANEAQELWGDVLVLTESETRARFTGFEVLRWTEHNLWGENVQGRPHHWHIYSVVARKS